MILPITMTSSLICATLALAFGLAVYHVSTAPRRNTIRELAGPPVRTLFGNHMAFVLECVLAQQYLVPCTHHRSVVRLDPPRPMLCMSRNMVGTYV